MTDFRKFKFVSPGMKIDEIDNTLRETLPRATGPVFIGRAKKGPIFKPIFVTSAKELVDIFGQPEPGNGANGDVWRNGDCLAPMYGLYAAYAFLQNHDALTFVRVAGDEHPTRTSGVGEAGWITTRTNYSDTDKKDGGAYAFFVGGVQASEGTLSVIYDTSLNGNCSIGGNISKSLLVKWENTLGVQIKISNSSSSPNRYQVGVWDGSSYVYDTTERNITTTTVPLLYGTVDTGLTISFTSLIGYTLNDTATATQTVSYSLDSNLGAIFYVDEGALALEGKDLNGNPVVGNAGFVVSTGPDYEFTLRTYKNAVNKNVYNQKISFNFNNRSSKYIRKVFNTNPTLVNEDITKTENVVNFWLGESFRSQVYKSVAKDSLEIVGCLLKIEKDGVSGANHLAPFKPAETGWIFSQCLDADGPGVYGSGVPGQYDPRKMKKLFKFHSIDGGSWFHANVKISIDRIRYSKSRLTPFGSFDVVVRAAHDTDKNPIILEMFSNCNLDVNSANFIMKKIGDVHYEWDAEEKRYVKYGSYENNSKYIYVEVDQDVLDGAIEPSLLPWGYFGPPTYGDVEKNVVSGNGFAFDNVSEWIQGGGDPNVAKIAFSISNTYEFAPLPFDGRVKFSAPSLRLRETFSEEGTSKASEVFWGARTLCWDVAKYDSDLQDYLRNDNLIMRSREGSEPGMKFSYIFTLDDICFEDVNASPSYSLESRAVYINDAYKYGRSITAGYFRKQDGNLDTTIIPDYKLLCDKDYARFTVVCYGGCDGLDVTEKDPFRNSLLEGYTTTDDATESYSLYSLLKAIDVVHDKDIVSYDMISIPGVTNTIINQQLVNLASTRKDCLAVIDLPGQYLPASENNQDEKYRIGSVVETVRSKQDTEIGEGSSYAATYCNWIKVIDPFNRTLRVWLPPSVAAAGVFAYARSRGDVWDAPAGYNNANLSLGSGGLNVVDTLFVLSAEDRDMLYENNINPIGKFPEGIIVMGQKTTQGIGSYLDRINIRLLVNHIKRYVEFKGKKNLFEPNIYLTWQRFINEIDPFLRDIQTRGGLNGYEIVFDDTTTTMEMIDRNEMYAKIYIQPTTVAEFFGVDLVIAKTGVSFVD